jgi:Mg-chelatase subunit ChlD
LSKHSGFEEISPEVGELDEVAFDEAMQNSPDETLSMLADLTAATDPALRDLARKLAGRILIELAQSGKPRPRGIGKMSLRKYQPDAGDIDIDASLDALNELRATGVVDADELRVRGWLRPGTAISLVVDRSGSMGGKPLANSAMAAASIAAREPADYSVLVFGKDVIAAKSQDVNKSGDDVVNTVLALRGFGTTDLAGALNASREQLLRSRASRKITVLLSDCRATVDGDAHAAALSLDELVVIAPLEDDAEARAFADVVGARFTTVSGPSDIPDAMRRVLD